MRLSFFKACFVIVLLIIPMGSSAKKENYSLFGTMLAFQSSKGFGGQKQLENLIFDSWLTLREHKKFPTFLSRLKNNLSDDAPLVQQTHFASNRDIVGAFTWNVIVPRPGEYDWAISDATMKAAGEAGITVSALVQPYSSWGSSETLDRKNCSSIDFAYFDYATGMPSDWEAYKTFLRKTVERYDGDGKNDMPGLTTRVSAWEIGNEVDAFCSGNLKDPENYVTLLRVSYQTIKKADPDAKVLNAGALELIRGDGTLDPKRKEFWNEFFALGGQKYIDVFNMHYNIERSAAKRTSKEWKRHLNFFSGHLHSRDIPIWVTEFGTYTGTSSVSSQKQSERFQASWYLRYTTIGMASGVKRYYIDLTGKDGDPTTGAAVYDEGRRPHLFLTTLQTLGEHVDGYTTVKRLRKGQFRFRVDGEHVFVLWSGNIPHKIKKDADVTVYYMDGTSQHLPGNTIRYSKKNPVIVK